MTWQAAAQEVCRALSCFGRALIAHCAPQSTPHCGFHLCEPLNQPDRLTGAQADPKVRLPNPHRSCASRLRGLCSLHPVANSFHSACACYRRPPPPL